MHGAWDKKLTHVHRLCLICEYIVYGVWGLVPEIFKIECESDFISLSHVHIASFLYMSKYLLSTRIKVLLIVKMLSQPKCSQ